MYLNLCCSKLISYYLVLRQSLTVPSDFPRNVVSQIHSPRAFTLSWEPPPPSGRNGNITGHVVHIINTDTGLDAFFPTTALSMTFSAPLVNVLPYRTYILQVASETIVGRGPFSTDVIVYTPEDSKMQTGLS